VASNRSVPADTLIGHVFYDDVERAVVWLKSNFEFAENFRYGDPMQGAQLAAGHGCIMIASTAPGRESPARLGFRTQMLSIFTEDVDGLYTRLFIRGIEFVEVINDTAYGERQFVAQDHEGHHWLFAQHIRDIAPGDWGAIVATPHE
jgi:uncharacterized glyoxalase superfamily protein PhnB